MFRSLLQLGLFAISICVGFTQSDDPFTPVEEINESSNELTWPKEPEAEELQAFKEPSLSGEDADHDSPSFRFVWQRTFHPPIAIRAFDTRSGPKLRIVRLDGMGGYELGKIDLDVTVDLDSAHFEDLKTLVSQPRARDPLEGLTVLQKFYLYPLDGSTWALEVRDAESYSYQIVPSPLHLLEMTDGKTVNQGEFILPNVEDFVQVCRKLLHLAKFSVGDLYDEGDLY